ncbi:MAG: amidohydrolase family protein [Halioglobus sp.]
MKFPLAFFFALILTATSSCTANTATGPSYDFDILIRSGVVVDGSGSPGYTADVGIKDGKIVFIGQQPEGTAREIVDASGRVVAPGFIDASSLIGFAYLDYTDMTITAYPDNDLIAPALHQGVTTLVWGEGGQWGPSTIRTFREYFTSGGGLGANVAVYAGHLAIRKEVMGMASRAPTVNELGRMEALVREGMELGALGLSLPFLVVPARYAEAAELKALARQVASFDGILNAHIMRDPVNAPLESIAEIIDIGREVGVPVKLEGMRAMGLRNKGSIIAISGMIGEARSGGVEVVTGQYPYDGAAAYLLSDMIVIPGEHLAFRKPFSSDRLKRLREMLRDPVQRARLKDATENPVDGSVSHIKLADGYDGVRIESVPGRPDLAGRYLVHIAEQRGVSPFDAMADLVIGADDKILIALGASDEEDGRALLVQPWNMISSFGEHVGFTPARNHPRSTGAFPRVLGYYVREEGLLSLPEAIRKMTSLPADFLRLSDRGRIKQGMVADIVVFDPARIAGGSTWVNPDQLATGVTHLVVNGVMVMVDGALTGRTPGQYVKRQTPGSNRPVASPGRARNADDDSSACVDEQEVSYICGFATPEDIVNVGTSRLVLASGGTGPGLMYLIDSVSGAWSELINSDSFSMQHDTDAWPECPGPMNLESFDVHGLSVAEISAGRFSIYSISHGEREAVEVYELTLGGNDQDESPALTWTGCVLLQQDGLFNSVAHLADGGFVTTRMIDRGADFKSAFGTNTGQVFEWHPGGVLQAVAGTELSFPNGIAVSADEQHLYVTASGTDELVRFDRSATPIGKHAVSMPMGPDNIHWDSRGKLVIAGAQMADPESCPEPLCFAGWEVIEVDPETLAISSLGGADGSSSMQRASAAIRVGHEIWASGPDRIARFPLN